MSVLNENICGLPCCDAISKFGKKFPAIVGPTTWAFSDFFCDRPPELVGRFFLAWRCKSLRSLYRRGHRAVTVSTRLQSHFGPRASTSLFFGFERPGRKTDHRRP
jgi:hypothetical protein